MYNLYGIGSTCYEHWSKIQQTRVFSMSYIYLVAKNVVIPEKQICKHCMLPEKAWTKWQLSYRRYSQMYFLNETIFIAIQLSLKLVPGEPIL